MLNHLPGITSGNLRMKTLRAKKIRMLFGKDGVGIEKIKQVSYSIYAISSLTNSQIQNVINNITSALPEKEILIRNELDINTLILLLQQKFKMTKKLLDKWRDNIAFEFRDNTKYWKKERESMPEADFLKHKKNFEAKMGVPTTSHKKELKSRFMTLIEYA